MALIEVEAPRLEDDLPAFEFAEDQLAAVARHRGGGKTGQIREGDGHPRLRLGAFGQGAQAGAQDDGEVRNKGRPGLEGLKGGGGGHGGSRNGRPRGWA